MAGVHSVLAAQTGLATPADLVFLLEDEEVSAIGSPPNTAEYTLQSGGQRVATNKINYDWMLEGTGSDYDVRATLTGGTPGGGSSYGTWHNLGSTRQWTLLNSNPSGTLFTSFLVEIRLASTQVVLASSNVMLIAGDTPL